MENFKEKFKENLINNFHNGSYLEIHSGDLDKIVEIADKLINKPVETTNRQPEEPDYCNQDPCICGNGCDYPGA